MFGVHMMELERSPLTEKEVEAETTSDPVLSEVYKSVLKGWKVHQGSEESLKPYWTRKDELSIQGGCILWGSRVLIPDKLRGRVLQELHDVHPGITRMKALSRSYFWWPKMDESIEFMARSCTHCAINRNNPTKAPVHAWETPTGPWERIHMDYAGPLLGKMFLIVVDAYSKWIEVGAFRDATSITTVNFLRRLFAMHGLPRVSVQDNGPAFIGKEFKEFMTRNGINTVYSCTVSSGIERPG